MAPAAPETDSVKVVLIKQGDLYLNPLRAAGASLPPHGPESIFGRVLLLTFALPGNAY